jgi:hypothetical protein
MQVAIRFLGLYLVVLLAAISAKAWADAEARPELARASWGPKTEELIVGKEHELVAQARGKVQKTEARKLRVVVFGAHPDDPETGCGGADRSPDERRP